MRMRSPTAGIVSKIRQHELIVCALRTQRNLGQPTTEGLHRHDGRYGTCFLCGIEPAGSDGSVMFTLPTYICLVLAVSAQRIWELQRSKRNTKALLEQGAYEVGAAHYPIMAALHTIWLFCCVIEAFIISELLRSVSQSPPSCACSWVKFSASPP